MRRMAILIALVMLALLSLSAAADGAAILPQIEFREKNFESGQMLPVYNGPGYEYERPTGWAKVSTDDTILSAGNIGNWTFVMYQKSGGGFRAGWIDKSKLMYNLGGRSLTLAQVPGRMTQSCVLTDDPKRTSYTVAELAAGTQVTVLAKYYDHIDWLYIEVWNGSPARGFVPAGYVSY
ncbi:MAG: hypothetical protein IJ242_11200 [Clostridia bacterium]|nr:hypothetical protein [Clostridia bacterium]